MDKDRPRKKMTVHHIIGQMNHIQFNVKDELNQILLTETRHIALNNYFGALNQEPRLQFSVLYDDTQQVLSEEAKQLLETLISLPDHQFYKKRFIKKK